MFSLQLLFVWIVFGYYRHWLFCPRHVCHVCRAPPSAAQYAWIILRYFRTIGYFLLFFWQLVADVYIPRSWIIMSEPISHRISSHHLSRENILLCVCWLYNTLCSTSHSALANIIAWWLNFINFKIWWFWLISILYTFCIAAWIYEDNLGHGKRFLDHVKTLNW